MALSFDSATPDVDPASDGPYRNKAEWRSATAARRRELDEETRAAEAAALTRTVHSWVDDPTRAHQVSVVCGYVPADTEPGDLALFDGLAERGVRVLMPVVAGSGPLDWAEYEGEDALVPARYGLREPGGRRWGPDAIASAQVVFVPALATDSRGFRLGKGAGFYDKSLVLAPDAFRVSLVRDEELVGELPAEDHDVRMHAVITPGCALVHLPLG